MVGEARPWGVRAGGGKFRVLRKKRREQKEKDNVVGRDDGEEESLDEEERERERERVRVEREERGRRIEEKEKVVAGLGSSASFLQWLESQAAEKEGREGVGGEEGREDGWVDEWFESVGGDGFDRAERRRRAAAVSVLHHHPSLSTSHPTPTSDSRTDTVTQQLSTETET